ncbi:MAG: alpha/beta hydrolase [Pseudomonadota bacterium]|nr:alpha/beta hydrolase [Pseudomonadota bacterium]
MPTIQTRSAPHPTHLHYVAQGEGKPVVLIHGWPLSHRMWESQMFALAENGFRAIAYDRRGFGNSGQPEAGYDYDTFAADLHDLITELDLHEVTLAGFSMGGGEVARYIGRYGTSRLSGAMLLGAVPPFLMKTADNPEGVDKSVFDGMIAGVKQDRSAFLASFFPNFFNADTSPPTNPDLIALSKSLAWPASPVATAACITAFGTTDFRSDLAKFDVPTLIVHGDSDRIVPADISGKRAHAAIVGSRFEMIAGAPHGFAATHAAHLNRLMLDFLKR